MVVALMHDLEERFKVWAENMVYFFGRRETISSKMGNLWIDKKVGGLRLAGKLPGSKLEIHEYVRYSICNNAYPNSPATTVVSYTRIL